MSYPGMPLIGSNELQSMFASGCAREELSGASWYGNGWPGVWLFDAVMNGVANSGGAGLE